MIDDNYEYRALGSYKEELFQLLVNTSKDPLCELLIDLMMPTLDDDRFDKVCNFVGGEYKYVNDDGKTDNVNLKGRLCDVPFVYSVISDTRNVICVDTNITQSTASLKEMLVTISVMCHKDSLEIDTDTKRKYRKYGYVGRNRIDIGVAILGDILNRSDKFGIGKLKPNKYNPVRSYYPNSDFYGKILEYTCTDFMKNYTKGSGEYG